MEISQSDYTIMILQLGVIQERIMRLFPYRKIQINTDENRQYLSLSGSWFIFFVFNLVEPSQDMKLIIETGIDSLMAAITVRIFAEMINVEHWEMGEEFYRDKQGNFFFGIEAFNVKKDAMFESRGLKKCVICECVKPKNFIDIKTGYCPNCVETVQKVAWN